MDRTGFNETILWRAAAQYVVLTGSLRAAFWALLVLATISIAMAIAVAYTLSIAVGSMILFAAWCVTFAMALRWVPQWWHQKAEYLLTDKRVIWKRGRFSRSIERAGISYARIHWYAGQRARGDLELVRDVPTGALRRKLTLILHGVEQPDQLWRTICGLDATTPALLLPCAGIYPMQLRAALGQRLAEGERVIWSDRPMPSWRRLLPHSARDIAGTCMGLLVTLIMARSVASGVPAARHVLEGGISPHSIGFIALVAALTLTSGLLFTLGAALVWTAALRPGLLHRSTRYLITNRRVLIAQGDAELHLDRSRIIDVIDSPTSEGNHDLFLILDGPCARAIAVSGAFQEGMPRELMPVLRDVVDAESAGRILRESVALSARPRLMFPSALTARLEGVSPIAPNRFVVDCDLVDPSVHRSQAVVMVGDPDVQRVDRFCVPACQL